MAVFAEHARWYSGGMNGPSTGVNLESGFDSRTVHDPEREQVERDLEQFAALEPTLGLDAQVEILDPRLQAAVRASMEDAGSWWLPTEPIGVPLSFEAAGFRLVDVTRRHRRHRIRRAARARKARRGWR